METRFLRSESPPEGRAKYRNNIPPTPKTVRMATPEHRGKLYQLWETVTVLMILFNPPSITPADI